MGWQQEQPSRKANRKDIERRGSRIKKKTKQVRYKGGTNQKDNQPERPRVKSRYVQGGGQSIDTCRQ